MDRDQIIRAGERARTLARRVADLMVASDVPAAHWDEVLARVSEFLAVHSEEEPAEPRPAD